MSRHPRLTGGEIVRALTKTGFIVTRVRGSHQMLRHADGRHTVVPVHRGETIGPGLTRQILRDVEMNTDDLQRLL